MTLSNFNYMEKNKSNLSRLLPIMFAFFAMGFVDMVGTATNYVKADFALSDTMANFLPSMVFLWFFFLSVPTGLMMNRIGKRKTVLLSLVVTALALVLPLCAYSYPVLLVSFCLLGIGNTLMQVSLNPLITCVVSGERLASTLTFGQFIKAIASFIAPIIASWASVRFGNWLLLYPIFLVFAIIAAVYLGMTKIEEEIPKDKSSNFIDCLKLLGDTSVLLFFLGIVAHVGIDVGVNTCAPKIIMERLALPLEKAGIATSIYFLFRTLGVREGGELLAGLLLRHAGAGTDGGAVRQDPRCGRLDLAGLLRRQRCLYGPLDGRTVLLPLPGRSLRRHRPCGLRQFQHLLDGLLQRAPLYA